MHDFPYVCLIQPFEAAKIQQTVWVEHTYRHFEMRLASWQKHDTIAETTALRDRSCAALITVSINPQ